MPKTIAKKKTTKPKPRVRLEQAPGYRLRRSPVHGTGLFATRTITKGETLMEYTGERISHAEADLRHAYKADDDNHTFLFTIDAKVVVDGGVGGNDSRFINHSCDPNCEVINTDGRLLVEVLRTVRRGEELAYDYNLTREPEDEREMEQLFACRCGTTACRGTMLAPPKKSKPRKARTKRTKPTSGRKKTTARKKAAA